MTNSSEPKVCAIVPSWNRKDDLRACLDSLAKQDYADLDVIVADNGSTDGSPEMVRADFPNVRLIANSENLGASIAKNQGVAATEAEFVWFLDSDSIVLEPTCASEMVRIMREHPDVGAVGGEAFEQEDGTLHIVQKTVCLNGETRTVPIESAEPEMLECDYLATCNLLARRDLIAEIGGFDPGYFILSEDKEIGWQIKKRGHKSIIDHRTTVLHSVSARQRRGDLFRKQKNNLRFVLLNFPWWRILLLPLFDLAYLFAARKVRSLKSKHASVMKHLSGPVKDVAASDRSLVAKVFVVGCVYVGSLVGAYVWNLGALPKTLWLRWRRPDYIAQSAGGPQP